MNINAITNQGNEIALPLSAVETLQAKLRGELLRAGDAEYDNARRVWNGFIDRRPALIARCIERADVVAALRFAHEHNLLISVRGGGHHVAGHAVCDGGLVIDLSQMKDITVDPVACTARAQPGVTVGELDEATQKFGLAVPTGVVSETGIAGLTLSGGMSWFRRKAGLTIDNLLAADVITAEGQFLRASESENPDLFWAIRGGGGNFGIVTEFTYRLHSLGQNVFFLSAIYPMEQARQVFQAWRNYTVTASDECTVDCVLWSIPAMEPFPEALHNTPVIVITGMYAGSPEEGAQLLQPLRELATPLMDLSGCYPFLTVQKLFDPFFPSGVVRCYWRSTYLTELSDAAFETVLSWTAKCPSPRTIMPLRHLGGAIQRVPEEATASGNRAAPFLLSIDSVWLEGEDADANIQWTRDFWAAMQPYSNGGVYANFEAPVSDTLAQTRAGHGDNYARLAAIKRKYDPSNRFRMNANILPAK
jgi:FAD/FMN-containing dehydrogenase